MHKLNKLKSIVGQPGSGSDSGSPVNLSLSLGHRLWLWLSLHSRVRLVCAGSMRIVWKWPVESRSEIPWV